MLLARWRGGEACEAVGRVDNHRFFVFTSYQYDPGESDLNLETSAAMKLAHLKAVIIPTDANGGSSGGGKSSTPDGNTCSRLVALTSIDREDGVGKTGACKLLCADEDVRRRFAGGASLWVDIR